MNSCPACKYDEFSYKELRDAYVKQPITCRNCGESIARYHYSAPLGEACGLTLLTLAMYVLIFWDIYTFIYIGISIYLLTAISN